MHGNTGGRMTSRRKVPEIRRTGSHKLLRETENFLDWRSLSKQLLPSQDTLRGTSNLSSTISKALITIPLIYSLCFSPPFLHLESFKCRATPKLRQSDLRDVIRRTDARAGFLPYVGCFSSCFPPSVTFSFKH